MEFTEWVDDVGGLLAAADLLGKKPGTVRSWYHLWRSPSAKAAGHICAVSGGRVDYNGIYAPFVAALNAADKPQ